MSNLPDLDDLREALRHQRERGACSCTTCERVHRLARGVADALHGKAPAAPREPAAHPRKPR